MSGNLMDENPLSGEEVVITGISGILPNSKIHEFSENVFDKTKMDQNSGVLPQENKYETRLSGVHESHSIDVVNKLLQEKTMEAIIDAGLHPSDLQNTKTGVFIGTSCNESDKLWLDNFGVQANTLTGSEKSTLAHELSYFLKLEGPSHVMDSACSSPLYAVEQAYRALRTGEIDNAIVAGGCLCLHPFLGLQFSRLGILSSDGCCKQFDKSNNDHVSSEGVAVLLLQKYKNAKRIYTQVIHAKSGYSQFKDNGIIQPDGEGQENLLADFYEECGINSSILSFLKSHATGQDDENITDINNSGFGGANCYILLRWNTNEKINNGIPKDNLPRLVCVSGMTEEAVTCLLDEINKHFLDVEYIKLLHDVFRKDFPKHSYRGYSVVSKSGEITRSYKYTPKLENRRLLYIEFGELSEWFDIGNQLLKLPPFAKSIQRMQKQIPGKFLRNNKLIDDSDDVVGNLVIKIAIIDVLKLLDIQPVDSSCDFLGQLTLAYCNELIDIEETIKCCLIFYKWLEEANPISQFVNKSLQMSVTSNTYKIDQSSRIFENGNSILDTNITTKQDMCQNLIEILENSSNCNLLKNKYESVNNFVKMLVNNDLKKPISHNSVVLQIGDSTEQHDEDIPLLTFPNSGCKNYLVDFLKTVGSLYEYGFNPQISKLFPSVSLPVSRGTKMISPYIKWKHDRNLFESHFELEETNMSKTEIGNVKVQLTDQEWTFLQGHKIDGNASRNGSKRNQSLTTSEDLKTF